MKNQEKNYGINWSLTNTYTSLPNDFFVIQAPEKVPNPELIKMNWELAKHLGIDLQNANSHQLANIFSGNEPIFGTTPIAQAYAGHQFGGFNMLGDGRAVLLAEQRTPQGFLVDLQLKGSGRTPFSRGGDGKATIGAMLREYLMSEALFGLGVPTTRSLAVIKTGEQIYRNPLQPGAVLCRIAKSHIRVGTFEFAANFLKKPDLKALLDYTVQRHYPELITAHNKALDFLKAVMQQQISLVVHWMRIGFIHGVMNTDNMSIAGETIDYGPCAMIDAYAPETVFSSIDTQGRYAFAKQPNITQWNLSCLAGALLPLIDDKREHAIDLALGVLNSFPDAYQKSWLQMMGKKLGIANVTPQDKVLVDELLALMELYNADFTATFRCLINGALPKEINPQAWNNWNNARLDRIGPNNLETAKQLMETVNPVFIPRNYLVEDALAEASKNNNFKPFNMLLEICKKPYLPNQNHLHFAMPPEVVDKNYRTFCGT